MSAEPVWPEWLTPEHTALHTAIENAIKNGTKSVYNSSDGAGLPWTEDGMVSCQASAVLFALKRDGWVPPDPVPVCEPAPMPECPDLGDDDEADGYWCFEGEGVIGGQRVKFTELTGTRALERTVVEPHEVATVCLVNPTVQPMEHETRHEWFYAAPITEDL